MPSGTEKDILKITEEAGGETSLGHVFRMLSCYSTPHLRSVVDSLGRRDYLDVLGNGRIVLTDKGRRSLGIEVDEQQSVPTDSFNY